jgi:hypothetical protein
MQRDNILHIINVSNVGWDDGNFTFTCDVKFNDKRYTLNVEAEIVKHDIFECYMVIDWVCKIAQKMKISDKFMCEIVLWVYWNAKEKQLI